MSQDQSDKNWVDTSASFAPTVLGAATGIVVGDLMQRDARRPVAFALAAVGICALLPSVVGLVMDKVNGPESRRGSRRTLRHIRDAGATGGEFDELEEEMYIG